MYDNGNFLNTNYQSEIDYSHYTVSNGEGAFGEDANYFTYNEEGYFIMVAELDSVTNFSITGNLGADGDGVWDTLRGNIEVNGIEYLVVTKQVNEQNSDPSINHIFIMETPDSLKHFVNDDTDDDYDEIEFGEEVELLHYILVATRESNMGTDLDSATLFGIAQEYIEVVTSEDGAIEALPEWLTISDASSGVILENSSKDLSINVSAEDLTVGDYSYTLILNNVGEEGFSSIDINLTVNDATTVSLDTELSAEYAIIYPNPASDFLYIETEIGSSVNIIDYTGRVISTLITSDNKEQLNVGDLSEGIYLIRVRNENNITTKQILIK
jgi:hypothetical protein